ncbi:MAG: hypothetical protein SGJ19_29130 [Planctomycetia bacterium]|nr:hypothetical protein [Planctomycetia bacterium]
MSLPVVDDRSGEDTADESQGVLFDGIFETLFSASDGYLHTFNGIELEQRSAIEFSMMDLHDEGAIVHAELKLHVAGRTVQPLDLLLLGYAGDGIVLPADFGASRLIESRVLDDTPSNLDLTYDVTALLTELRNVNATHAGFAFQVSHGATLLLASQETRLGDQFRPELHATYAVVPEPSSIAICLISVGAIALVCKVS